MKLPFNHEIHGTVEQPSKRTHGKPAAFSHFKVPTQGPCSNSPKAVERETEVPPPAPLAQNPTLPTSPSGGEELVSQGRQRKPGRSGVCTRLKKSVSSVEPAADEQPSSKTPPCWQTAEADSSRQQTP